MTATIEAPHLPPIWPESRDRVALRWKNEAEKRSQALGEVVKTRVIEFLEHAKDPSNGYDLSTSDDGTVEEVRYAGELIAKKVLRDEKDEVFTLFRIDPTHRIVNLPAVETDGNETFVITSSIVTSPRRQNAIHEGSLYINYVLIPKLPEVGNPVKPFPLPLKP